MLLFPILPIQLPCITPIGMKILGIFIGTLYLWTTSDPTTSSILAIFMVGISGSSNIWKRDSGSGNVSASGN